MQIDSPLTLGAFILALALGTFATRALPFVLFAKKIPNFVLYLGRLAPPMIIGILLVFCFKDILTLSALPHLPLKEIIASNVVIVLFLLTRFSFLAILCGTGVYMFLTQSKMLETMIS
ncbi:branched-chain amino acid transporter permease [Helicobacter himalayensis]|uniref:branched-chain amino acid transporter permease n=1 Tax=Helicobacter himalayensis TaxID=1591088 RepID=UPI0008297D90|nr:AzlD domain-containing protein [Helicobacter himalayensis]